MHPRRVVLICAIVFSFGLSFEMALAQVSPPPAETNVSRVDGKGIWIDPEHMIYRQPGPILESTLYVDGSQVRFNTEIETRPICGSDCSAITLDDLLKVAALHRQRFDNPVSGSPEGRPRDGGEPRSGLDIVFDATNVPLGVQDAIDDVEAYLESVFDNPITVTIALDFHNEFPDGVLGWTYSYRVDDVPWTTARTGLINGMDGDDFIQFHLPLVAGDSIPVRYDGWSSSVTNEDVLRVNIATYNATIGTYAGDAAGMAINTNFDWDYFPANGITPGSHCFQSVLVHEVGHALGFVSAADYEPGYRMELMDAYRFQNTDGAGDYNPDTTAEFSTTPRLVDYNTPNNDHNTNFFELHGADVEYRMSDGTPSQASHFLQGEVDGIMQPQFGSGDTFYPDFFREPDIVVFDAIGWDYSLLSATNDACDPQSTPVLTSGSYSGTSGGTSNDGSASCGSSSSSPDVWYRFITGADGTLEVDTCGAIFDTVISIHSGCPGTTGNEIACNNDSDACGIGSNNSYLSIPVTNNTEYFIRVSGVSGAAGLFALNVSGPDADETPPTPDPPVWTQLPTAISMSEVQMEAWAEDANSPPVEYRFEGLAGGHTRDWSTDATYTDTGLPTNALCAYYLYARDSSFWQNETSFSLRGVYTLIETPSELTDGAIDETSIEVFTAPAGGGSFTNLNVGNSGIFFDVSTTGGTPVGGGDANTWVQYSSQSISATGLSPGTTYRFRVQARNQYGALTDWYPAASYIEFATTGGTCGNMFGDINGDTYIDGADIGGFVRAKLELGMEPGEDEYCSHVEGNTEQEDIEDFVVLLLN